MFLFRELIRKVDTLNEGVTNMAADLTTLTAQVKANTDLEASAVQLITGIAAQLKAAQTDPAQVAALANQLQTSATALAAAITANTPDAPAPAPTPGAPTGNPA